MTPRTKRFVGGMVVGASTVYALRQRRAVSGPGGGVGSWPRRYGLRADDIAGLEAATLDAGAKSGAGLQSRPLALALRLVGGGLVLYSVLRGGRLRRAARALGVALLSRSGWPTRSTDAAGVAPAVTEPAVSNERRRIVDIQKTFYIEAPVDQVYTFWSDYENFPLFMSTVHEVQDLGDGRSEWTVQGPAGVPIRWTAWITEQRPNEVIAWRSEPDTVFENAGIIRFRPEGVGTRLDLRFCYRPPAGGAREATELLGADPRVKLNEDLGRLKALLEAAI